MNPSVPTRHCSRWQEEEAHLSRKSRRTFSPAGRTAGGGRPTVLHEKRGLPLAFFWESVYEISLWCGQSVPLERFFRATVRIYGGCHVQAVRILRQIAPDRQLCEPLQHQDQARVQPQPSECAPPVRQRRSPHGFRVHPLPALRCGYEARCPQGRLVPCLRYGFPKIPGCPQPGIFCFGCAIEKG